MIFCLSIHFSGSESPYISKRRKFYLMGSGVSNEKNAREYDESDVTSKSNKNELEDKNWKLCCSMKRIVIHIKGCKMLMVQVKGQK